MARPKRNVLATAQETLTPPDSLPPTHSLARITKAAGNNLYDVELPSGIAMLVEMPARFRSTIWVKRGSFVVVDTDALADRDNKLGGEIVNVVREEKQWRKMSYWPKEFAQKPSPMDDSDDGEESRVGKMPSSDDDSDS